MPNRNIVGGASFFNLLRILLSTALEIIQHVEDQAPTAARHAENRDPPAQNDEDEGFVLIDEPLPDAAPWPNNPPQYEDNVEVKWAERLRYATALGRFARQKLQDPEAVFEGIRPESIPQAKYWIVVRDKFGTVYNPVACSDAWKPIAGRVLKDGFKANRPEKLAPSSMLYSFASKREVAAFLAGGDFKAVLRQQHRAQTPLGEDEDSSPDVNCTED